MALMVVVRLAGVQMAVALLAVVRMVAILVVGQVVLRVVVQVVGRVVHGGWRLL